MAGELKVRLKTKKGPQRGWGSLSVQGVWALPKERWGNTYSSVFRKIGFSF